MKYPVVIAPAYLAELRRRIEAGPGMMAVAKTARMSRMTLWGLLNNDAASAPRATNDAVERARLALAKLEPGAEPMPPPVVSVRDSDHHHWIALGERLLAAHPAATRAALANPTALTAAVLRLGSRRRR